MRIFLLFLLLPALAYAKSSEKVDHQIINFSKAGGGQPAHELLLHDDSKIWVHGCNSGSRVTLNGIAAGSGEYRIKDTNHIIKVDEIGNLVESINHISGIINCMGA